MRRPLNGTATAPVPSSLAGDLRRLLHPGAQPTTHTSQWPHGAGARQVLEREPSLEARPLHWWLAPTATPDKPPIGQRQPESATFHGAA